MIHLLENPISAGKMSPIILHLRPRCSRNMKHIKKRRLSAALKKKKSSSIKEITEGSFNAAVQKSSAAVTHNNGGGSVSSSSWVKSELLGRGAYGSVYLATSKNEKNKKERAIKTAEVSRASSLMDEARILLRLRSPFVIRCFGGEIAREEEDDDQLFGDCIRYNLVLEYCSGQSIAELIEDNQGGLPESDVKIFALDILYGLRYIHDQNIIHCDIKPENLLLCPADRRLRPNGYYTKIGDFGLAMEKGSIEYGNGRGHKRGTTRYMASELISHGIVDYGVDMWALGCTVLEMLTGEIAWGEHGDLGFEDWVNLIGHNDFIPYIPDWLSEDAQDFLSRCLERDVGKRWSSHALTNHPFLVFVPLSYHEIMMFHNQL